MDDKSTATILNALLPLFSYEVDSKKDLLIKFPIPRPFSSSPSLESKSSKMNSMQFELESTSRLEYYKSGCS